MKTLKVAGYVGLGLFLFFLMGCGASPVQSTGTAPVTASRTLTVTPTAKRFTGRPTWTASPTVAASLLIPVAATVAAHPLALDEFNAGTEMKRVNIYGTGKLNDMTFSPDGKILAAATGRGITLYDGKSFEQISFIDVNDSVNAIAFSPDGLTIAAAIDGKVSLWSTLSGQKLSTLDGELVYIWTLAYGKGGYVAALGSTCGSCGYPENGMILWDSKTGKQIYVAKNIWHSTQSLAFTADGKKLAFGGSGLDVVATESGKLVETYSTDGDLVSEPIDSPSSFIFSSDETLIFVNSYEFNKNQILDLTTKNRQNFSLCSSRFVHADQLGACFVKDKAILFDLANGKKIAELDTPGTNDELSNRAAFRPDGKIFLYQTNNTLHLMDVQTGSELKTLVFSSFENVDTGIILLNGKENYAAALQNGQGQVDLVDIETGALLQTYALPNSQIDGFAFRPGGKIVAAISDKKTLTLWDIQTQQVIYQTTFSTTVQSPFTFSRDGMKAFFIAFESSVVDLDFLKEGDINPVDTNSYGYTFADAYAQNDYHFNKAGDLIFLHYEEKHPKFQNATTNEKIILPIEAKSDSEYLESFSFSHDDKFLAFGNPTDIYVWNLETMKPIATLRGHEERGGDGWFGKIRNVFFSPQSNLLVSVGWDGTTRLWNINGGRQLRLLNVCCSATFTADGRYLLTAGNGVLRVWGIPK